MDLIYHHQTADMKQARYFSDCKTAVYWSVRLLCHGEKVASPSCHCGICAMIQTLMSVFKRGVNALIQNQKVMDGCNSHNQWSNVSVS